MGIAFGYAYAGSVSMLTVTFSDIRGVMMLGHSLTVLTILMLIKPTLLTTMNTQPVAIEDAKPKPKEKEEHVDSSDDSDKGDDSVEEEKESLEESGEEGAWQDESIDWEQPPDAIDCEVNWDEEEVSGSESTENKTEVFEADEDDDVELIEDDDVEAIDE